jgi:WS/DGAT/MGAT family acyltransferase
MAQARTRTRRPQREPMSRVDTAWLRMETASNPMMITAVLMFDDPIALPRLRQLLKQRFLAYRRFRQRPVLGATGAVWETDRDFDLDWHLQEAALPGRGGKAGLERFVSMLASTPLDGHRPRWQFHLIERHGKGSALVARIHHCYADGIALVQVLLSLTDTTPDAAPDSTLDQAWLKHHAVPVAKRVGAARSVISRYGKLGSAMLDKGMELYRDPGLASVLAREGGEIARELVHALSLPDDPGSVLRGRLGNRKRAAWAEPLDLEEVKAVGRAAGCTVNDVLMAAAAGALRAYMLERGEAVDGMTLRATVPVNLRPLEHARQLGNHFGLVFLDLPVGEANPLRRLHRVAACMRDLKQSRQAVVAYGLLAALGMAPESLQSLALELFSRKASAVATNVPGPQQPLYLAGAKLREMMFWVPQTGSIGLGLSILSYHGKVQFGLIADARLVPDPHAVTRRFAEQFEQMLYVALMANWDDTVDAAAAEALMPGTA